MGRMREYVMSDYHSTAPDDRSFRMLEDRIEQLERQNGDLQAANNAYRARFQQAEASLAIVDDFIDKLPALPEKTPVHTGPIEVLDAYPA